MVVNLSLFDDVVIEERNPARRRYQFKFWLDISKTDELTLAQHADNLKQRRQWQPFIRDAFKLLVSLHEKRVDVLVSLFPWIDEYFKAKYAPPAQDLTAVIARQTEILAQLASRPAPPALPAPSTGPKPLNIPKFDTPTFDDDDLDTIQLKRDTSTNSAGNFLNSLSALAGNAFVQAAPDDGKNARASFAGGLGNLFGDDDDDDF